MNLKDIINKIDEEVKSFGIDFWTFDQYKEYALTLLREFGWVCIPMTISPLKDGKYNKKPLVAWRELASKKPTVEELDKIWEQAVADKRLVQKYKKLGEETRQFKKEQKATAIGVICGRISGITVLDIDDIKKFKEKLDLSDEEVKSLVKENLSVKTPSGGVHLYFEYDEDLPTTTQQPYGFDIRNDNSLIVIPPSRLPNEEGGEVLYRLINGSEIKPIPNWLKEKLLPLFQKKKPPLKTGEVFKEEEKPKKFRKLPKVKEDKIVDAFAPVWLQGHRHNLTIYLAGTLYKSRVDEETAKDIVSRICSLAGDEEEGERLYQVNYTYARGDAGEEIKGISGLEEELSQLVEEGIITEEGKYHILSTLQEVLGIPKDRETSKFILLQYNPPAGVANLADKKVIVEWRKNKDGEFIFGKKLVNAYLSNAVVKYEPDTHARYFEITLTTATGKSFTFEGTITEIVSAIRTAGLHGVDRNKLEPALASLLTDFEDKGLVEIKELPRAKGFFLSSEGELIANLDFISQNPLDPEKVKEALKLLDLYVSDWGTEKIAELSTVIKWILTSPFFFVRKKLTNNPFKWLFVVGIKDTGKTQDARLARVFWGEEEEVLGASSVSTPARLSRAISKSTLPIVVDEAASLFPSGARTDSKEYEIIEELKRVWGSVVARRTHRNYNYIEELSLSPIIFTANRSPLLDAPLRKRILVIQYPSNAAVKDPIARKGFNLFIQSFSEVAPYIGYATYLFLKDNIELIKEAEDFQSLGKAILNHLYSEYLGTIPEWVEFDASEVDEMSEVDDEKITPKDIAMVVVKYLGEIIREGLGKDTWRDLLQGQPLIDDLVEKARMVDPTIPIAIYEPADKFERFLAFKRQFLQVLAENGIEIPTLKVLGEIFKEADGGFKKRVVIRHADWLGISIAYAPTSLFNEVLIGISGGSSGGNDNPPEDFNF